MVKRKIVVSEYDNIAAIFDEDRAVEFIIHRGDILLGDIFLVTVENILPSIDAAFVNVGSDKMGFLHASDVPGRGDLRNRLQPKQQLVVQVMKEPTGHKGPRVTTNISLPGRFLVMMPESKGISISRKIYEPKERSRLKSAVSMIKPAGVGVIIRTEALGQKDSDIQDDFETLLERWQSVVSMADTAKPPTLLHRDQDLLYRVIREAVNEDVSEIIVDTQFGHQRAQQLLQNWNMDKGIKVSHYTGSQPVMIGTGIDREIRQALQTKVPLPSGGYLYIQPTEALCVVDVNSGKFTSLSSQAETIRQTNLEACKEIARQLRLRNIGGMIIVDFIDMESRADQLAIMESFENELEPDKAKPQIGQLSDLGLVEMTRHRQGQALSEIFTKKCPSCFAHGHIMEEFNWSPSGMHKDHRDQRGGNRGFIRHKLPLKHAKTQAVPKPNASRQQQSGRPSLRMPVLLEQPTRPGDITGDKPSHLNIGFLFLAHEKKQQQTLEAPPEQERGRDGGREGGRDDRIRRDRDRGNRHQEAVKNLKDHYNELTEAAFGLKYAHVTKLSNIPPMNNSILSRINPKATDIITLVKSVEGSPNMGGMHAGLDDDQYEDAGYDDQDDDSQEGSEGRESAMAPDRRNFKEQEPFFIVASDNEDDNDDDADDEQPVPVGVGGGNDDDYDVMDSDDDADGDTEGAESSDTQSEKKAAADSRRRGRPPKRSNSRTKRS
ncbi:MAG: Rne/Rng family ribonuclease [Candidatus Melainabacteria bacterium]